MLNHYKDVVEIKKYFNELTNVQVIEYYKNDDKVYKFKAEINNTIVNVIYKNNFSSYTQYDEKQDNEKIFDFFRYDINGIQELPNCLLETDHFFLFEFINGTIPKFKDTVNLLNTIKSINDKLPNDLMIDFELHNFIFSNKGYRYFDIDDIGQGLKDGSIGYNWVRYTKDDKLKKHLSNLGLLKDDYFYGDGGTRPILISDISLGERTNERI